MPAQPAAILAHTIGELMDAIEPTPARLTVKGVRASVATVLDFYARTFAAERRAGEPDAATALAAGLSVAVEDIEPRAPGLREILRLLLTDTPFTVDEAARRLFAQENRTPGETFDTQPGKTQDALLNRAREILGLPPRPDDVETCIACERAFRDGDPYLPDVSGGFIHHACCGPERESYVGPDGEPLKPGDPLPIPEIWS